MTKAPIKVAIVGGGCAGVTTAFELSRPEHQGKYQVTIYQNGWRLGGKGASGRGKSGRIEEHGLHLWMGFYENAFQLLRECYEELDRDPSTCPITDWRDAFSRDPFVGVADKCADGQWRPWTAIFPAGDGDPGDPLKAHNPFTMVHYLTRAIALLGTILSSINARQAKSGLKDDFDISTVLNPARPSGLIENIETLLKLGQVATVAGIFKALQLLAAALNRVPQLPESQIQSLLSSIKKGAYDQLKNLIDRDDECRRLWEMADIIIACIQGAFAFGLMTHPKGFDAIDDYDWREWLKINGAAETSVNSAFMRGIYDLLFAYKNGDIQNPQISAGQALRGAVRMFFSYRGALFWKMNAGMGDIVFSPFYEVLKKRGVKFEFFHRLDKVTLIDAEKLNTDELPYVESLQFSVQAKIEGGKEYQPLVDVKGLPCWPSSPDYTQLTDGEELKKQKRKFESDWDTRKAEDKTIKVIDDFDFVVLAIGLGAIPRVCDEIIQSNTRWRDMVNHVATVETQAFQIWMRDDMKDIGWEAPPINLSGYVTPFDTWADMRHLIEREDWADEPKSIAYFCSVLNTNQSVNRDSEEYPEFRAQEVRQNAIRFLNNDIQHLWPTANQVNGEFRWELLLDADTGRSDHAGIEVSERCFDTQFWTANVNASDRYILSLPGTLKYRISPLDLSYDNLTIAGDWTECSHNAGCVEAAVMSGRLAAHALSGSPELSDITGFDHP